MFNYYFSSKITFEPKPCKYNFNCLNARFENVDPK